MLEPLTRRELEVLDLLAGGLTSKEIAGRLTLAVSSVRWYIQQIYGKLGVNGKRQAVTRASELGLIHLAPSNYFALPRSFPLLAGSIQTPNNLPNQVSSFIGRETEIADLMGLISKHRLVTLTGSGGTGKTRLSLRVAEEMLSRFSDGVWFVELASLSNSDRLLPVVASTFGLQETTDMPIRDILLNYLKNRSMLLVIDNCEHMITACAEMADFLLHNCSKLTLLATSREALRVDGEIVYRVPSLSLPDPLALPPLEELLHFEAIRLFVERALATYKSFQLTDQNASVVIQICRRLDGIPLALELAAARLSAMSLEQVTTRLDDCFRLLTAGLRTALPRQQTIRASIEWSYNLLNEKERLLLRRLSIFSGSWTLEAAEEVCGFDGIDDFEVLELLASLVDKSLVSVVEGPSRTRNFMAGRQDRYRMLETIRQYAAEQLVSEIVTENNAIEEMRERHLDYFARLAGQMAPGLQGHDQSIWVDFITSELDNIRSVLDWAMGPGNAGNLKKGLELVNGLMWFWWYFGYAKDALTWLSVGLSQLLEQADPPILHVARTYKTIAVMHYLVSDYPKSISYFERSIALFRPMGPSSDLAEALCIYALVRHQAGNDPDQALVVITEAIEVSRCTSDLNIQALGPFVKGIIIQQADIQEARSSLEKSLGIINKAGNELMADNVIRILGSIAMMEGDLGLARNYLQTGLSISQKFQAKQHLTWDLSSLGDLAYFEGDFVLMESYFQECLARGEEIGFRRPMVWSIHHLGVAARRQGQLEQSEDRFHKSLALAQENGFEELVLENLAGLAGILIEHGRIAQAASLLGMVEAHGLEMLGPIAQVEFERDRAEAQERLPEAVFRFAWEEGRRMTLTQALEYRGKAKV